MLFLFDGPGVENRIDLVNWCETAPYPHIGTLG